MRSASRSRSTVVLYGRLRVRVSVPTRSTPCVLTAFSPDEAMSSAPVVFRISLALEISSEVSQGPSSQNLNDKGGEPFGVGDNYAVAHALQGTCLAFSEFASGAAVTSCSGPKSQQSFAFPRLD
jgi:hypothetical protein